jgi:heme/copper-type cytochrome/quinol oxidase subunit 3
MPTDRQVPDYFGSGGGGGGGDENTPRQPSFASAGTVGMLLFLAALAVLFGASLVAFVMIRYSGGPKSPPPGAIHLPNELWLSTVLVIGVSIALARASRLLREGRQRSSRNALTAALALAAGFLTVQAPALFNLLARHQELRASGTHLYGLIFFLVLLHALHVVGGMVALIYVTLKAHRGGYEVQSGGGGGSSPIGLTTLYWHFLDGVWVVMFAILFLMR